MDFNQNVAFAGLGTFTFIAPEAGVYFFEGKLSLPKISNGGGQSECLVTINLNASPVYVGLVGADGFKKDILLALNDSVTIVLSSSAAPDQGKNAIKSVFSIGQGV